MAGFQFLYASILVALTLVLKSSAAIGPVADLLIVNGDISPDGYERAAVLAGGSFPGPIIAGKKGDHFRINVVDLLTNHTMLKSTSVHWHGLFQKGTNWADGPAFVNQCPISSGNSFLYDFHVPDQAGTFWYHSHLSTQYCDGLRGPLVVYDPQDPHKHLYDVDNDETVITLADWYHIASKLGPLIRFGGADSVLINGKGRSLATPTAELAVIPVIHGKRYRFRLVSVSCEPNFTFSIDGHALTVIEADAISTQPLVVDSIQIYAGQRYSFVLHANQSVDNYWIRSNPNYGNVGFEGGMNSAILRYIGAAPTDPKVVEAPVSKAPLVETALRPLKPMPVPGRPEIGGVDMAINFAFNFNGTNFFMNGETFVPPTVPVLLQIMSGAQSASDLLPSGTVYVLPSNATIEISFPETSNAPGSPHPLHLHGHTFAVVRSAGSTEYNYENPIWRDVVNTGNAGDNATIRFRTDNPGPWFLHCHIDPHLEMGFAVVMVEDTPDIKASNPEPKAWDKLCPTYDALAVEDQ